MKVSILALAAALCLASDAFAQAAASGDRMPYSRRNTFTAFAEYSNDSSHIILGQTPDRKLAGLGVQYERRILGNRFLTWSYMAEFRPFIVSSDPAATFTGTICIPTDCLAPSTDTSVVLKCVAGTSSFTINVPQGFPPESETVTTVCSRQQTIAQGGSPIGFRINPTPRHPLQLTFSSNGGYMFATKAIPVPQAGSFNFTFNFGAGLEYFYRPYRSIRLEYLVQHYSNHFTASQNPGVDSGFIRFAYAFGR